MAVEPSILSKSVVGGLVDGGGTADALQDRQTRDLSHLNIRGEQLT
jgi:hypothetical protein